MIKSLCLSFVLLFSSNLLFAQSEEYKTHQSIYNRALSYNDFAVAKNALYNMMELQPNNVQLLDTLSLLYFEQREYISAAIVAQEAAMKDPNNLLALELAGTSFENVGLNDKALEHYEPLYAKNGEISILYKIAFLQYRLKRFDEASVSSNRIIRSPEANDLPMVFGKKDQTTQQVPMIAAAYRLQGLIAYEQNDNESAIAYFELALEYAPDFEIVVDAVNQLKGQ